MMLNDIVPYAVVAHDGVFAPFMECERTDSDRLKRMGVIDDEESAYDVTVTVLASTFASNFYDRLMKFSEDCGDYVVSVFAGISNIFVDGETMGLYYFILLNCGLMDFPPPRELMTIARREDILCEYLQIFTETLIQAAREEPEPKVDLSFLEDNELEDE